MISVELLRGKKYITTKFTKGYTKAHKVYELKVRKREVKK